MSQTSDVSVPPGKSGNLVPLPDDNLSFGTPLARISSRSVPTELFFVRSSYPPPTIAPADWRMRLEGLVGQPRTLDLAALQRLPAVDQECWLECAGNSRSRYVPPAEGNQWGHHAVADAVFTGSPCSTCSELAGGSARTLSSWSLLAATMPAFSAPCRARSRSTGGAARVGDEPPGPAARQWWSGAVGCAALGGHGQREVAGAIEAIDHEFTGHTRPNAT